MQFAVPQFTDVEDKLIGPLTLKQFLMLLAAGGLALFFWSIFGLSIFFFIFAAPCVILGIALAFGKYNSRPLYSYVGSFIYFISRPQVRIFKREDPVMVMKMEAPKKVEVIQQKVAGAEAESRLRKLAYLLDQKTEEEKELIQR